MSAPRSKTIIAIIRLGGHDAVKQFLKTTKRAKGYKSTEPQHRCILAFYARENYIQQPFDQYIGDIKEKFGLNLKAGDLEEIFSIVKKRKDLRRPIFLVDLLREKAKELIAKLYPNTPRRRIKLYRLSPARIRARIKTSEGLQDKEIKTVRGFLKINDYQEPRKENQQQ